MNNQELQGKWKQFKGSARQQWGKLTDDDLDQIEGRRQELVGRIQERYGKALSTVEEEVSEWMDSLESRVT